MKLRTTVVGALLLAPSANHLLMGQQRDYKSLLEINKSLSGLNMTTQDAVAFDASASRIAGNREAVEALRRQLLGYDCDGWPVERKVDYLLVLSGLNGLEFEHRVVRPWNRDPGYYLDPIRSIPYAELPLPETQLPDLRNRLAAVPRVLAHARQNLNGEASKELADLAIFHLERYDGVGQGEPLRQSPPAGMIGWYGDLLERVEAHHPQLREEAEAALRSVSEYRDWLVARKVRMTGASAVGLDHYNWFLKHVRLMPFNAEDVRRIGERELNRAVTFLKIEQNRNAGLPELEVAESREEYEARVTRAEEDIRALIRRQRLLTIPEETGPFETDAFWRAGMKRHFWEELQYRDARNNHIHASIPGHRLDVMLASRNQNPIRREMQDGGRVEGWAFYIEEMLLQAGLLEGNPRARELFYIAQLARAVRIPTELRMQSGEFSMEQAIRYMIDQVPYMEENLARYDLEIYLRMPTYGMNYVMGRIQLEQLLAEQAIELGGRFRLGEFHDRFLSYGLIPISMIRWEMTGKDDEAKVLWEDLRRAE